MIERWNLYRGRARVDRSQFQIDVAISVRILRRAPGKASSVIRVGEGEGGPFHFPVAITFQVARGTTSCPPVAFLVARETTNDDGPSFRRVPSVACNALLNIQTIDRERKRVYVVVRSGARERLGALDDSMRKEMCNVWRAALAWSAYGT